jgi:hypothetical protein
MSALIHRSAWKKSAWCVVHKQPVIPLRRMARRVGTCQRGSGLRLCGETKERTPNPGASSTEVLRLKRATRFLTWGGTVLLDFEAAVARSATFPCPANV